MDAKSHWDTVHTTKASTEVSWYQPTPTVSLELLDAIGLRPESSVADIGGGDSLLVDALLARGVERATVLDISGAALRRARQRLGEPAAARVTWIEADITDVVFPPASIDVWHDRAVFHFLTAPEARQQYVSTATHAVRSGGTLIIATFAADGPLRCSGLEVARYTPDGLAQEFGAAFHMERGFAQVHLTPGSAEQRFTWVVLRRV